MNFHFEEEKKKEKQKKIIKEIIRWTLEIAAVILIAFLIVHFFLIRTSMVGSSMEDTLLNGQHVIVNKMSYMMLSPSRGDVIAFHQNEDDEESPLTIRRIVGLPGEKVQIKNGEIYIDGEKLEEKHKMTTMESGGLAGNEITLSENEYFVLGDNRNDSEDSRFRSFGNVKSENITGKVIFKLDPFSLIGSPTIEKTEKE